MILVNVYSSIISFTYFGMIHRKTRLIASLWPMWPKSEKYSFNPALVSALHGWK